MKIPHDRQLDSLPAVARYTSGGMVLGRDVDRRVPVGVGLVAALAADEHASRTAVVAGSMPAGGAHLGGFARVNPAHRYASLLGLVLDKGAKLGERPTVQSASLCAATSLGARANVSEVLHDDSPAWRTGLDNPFGENVVAVATKPRLSAAHLLEMSLGRLRALCLKSATKLEVAALNGSPALLTKEPIVGGDGGLGNAEVHANDLRVRCDVRWGDINNDVE